MIRVPDGTDLRAVDDGIASFLIIGFVVDVVGVVVVLVAVFVCSGKCVGNVNINN